MSWSQDQIIELRNKAAARAQRCAPIVREAEELLSLVRVLDNELAGVITPYASELDGLRPVTTDAPVPSIANGHMADKQPIKDRVINLLAQHPDSLYSPADIASVLGISADVTSKVLRRALQAGLVDRPRHSRYCYKQRQLAA